jgi:hypothetical protein
MQELLFSRGNSGESGVSLITSRSGVVVLVFFLRHSWDDWIFDGRKRDHEGWSLLIR